MRGLLAGVAALAMACAGPQGEPGRDGIDGSDGSNGAGLLAKYACYYSPAGIGLRHDAYVFADGSVMTSCEVGLPGYVTTGFQLYKASQEGAAKWGCLVGVDVGATSSWGFWAFEKSGAGSRAVYHDTGDTHDGETWALPCSVY